MKKMNEMLKEYKNLFAKFGLPTSYSTHRIVTGDSLFVAVPLYSLDTRETNSFLSQNSATTSEMWQKNKDQQDCRKEAADYIRRPTPQFKPEDLVFV